MGKWVFLLWGRLLSQTKQSLCPNSALFRRISQRHEWEETLLLEKLLRLSRNAASDSSRTRTWRICWKEMGNKLRLLWAIFTELGRFKFKIVMVMQCRLSWASVEVTCKLLRCWRLLELVFQWRRQIPPSLPLPYDLPCEFCPQEPCTLRSTSEGAGCAGCVDSECAVDIPHDTQHSYIGERRSRLIVSNFLFCHVQLPVHEQVIWQLRSCSAVLALLEHFANTPVHYQIPKRPALSFQSSSYPCLVEQPPTFVPHGAWLAQSRHPKFHCIPNELKKMILYIHFDKRYPTGVSSSHRIDH